MTRSSAKPIFLAVPDYNRSDEARIEGLQRSLNAASNGAIGQRHLRNPHVDIGSPGVEVDDAAYVERYLAGLREARVVLALLDGRQVDDRTAFAVGYARALEIPVVGLWTETRQVASPLLVAACELISGDVREVAAHLAGYVDDP